MLSTCLAQVGEIFLNMPILDDGKRVFFFFEVGSRNLSSHSHSRKLFWTPS